MTFDFKTSAARVSRKVRGFVRWLFCRHEWVKIGSQRFTVTRNDGSEEGEVTLTAYECRLCQRERLFASDRVHTPNAQAVRTGGNQYD